MQDFFRSALVSHVSLEQILPEEVIVITNSLPGAMGISGLFEVYTIHEGRVLKFEGNWYQKLNVQEVNQHLPESAKIDEKSLILGCNEDWSIFGGGMGNMFVILTKYYPELNDRCLLSPMYFYRDRIPVMENLLRDIASGFTPQELPMEDVANELIKFALRDFTGHKGTDDKVTAVLWCDSHSVYRHHCHVRNGEIVEGICENWKQNVVDDKYDKTHIRIDFGNQHAFIRRADAPDQKTIMVYDIIVNRGLASNGDGAQISFVNGRPLVFPERPSQRRRFGK